MYQIEIENDYRDTFARIEYRWYASVVTRFESVYIRGMSPSNNGEIRIYLNGKLYCNVSSKSNALGEVRKLIEEAPALCRDDFLQNISFLLKAIEG